MEDGTLTTAEHRSLQRAISTVLDDCFDVHDGEGVLIVGDATTRALSEALWTASLSRQAEAAMVFIDVGLDGEPPATVAAAMSAADVYIAATRQSLSHTNARKAASEQGARGATLPGVTAEMLSRTMDVDLSLLRRRGTVAAEALTAATTAHLTCPQGTDIVFDIGGRAGVVDDGNLTAPGAFGNLPAGEAAISPVTGSGRIAVSSVTPVGILSEPMNLTVEHGRLVGADGPHGADFISVLQGHGARGTNLAELGMGTNDGAAFTGIVLEDEKVIGTAHIAFGASDAFGGSVYVPIHRDVMVLQPTLELDGRKVLDRGEWLLDEGGPGVGRPAGAHDLGGESLQGRGP